MKNLELTMCFLFIVGMLGLTGYVLNGSYKATIGIKQHLIDRGLR